MNKIILLVATLLLSFACSKDDENITNLEVTKSNLKGKWYYSEIILEDGSKMAYSKACNSNRDYIEISETGTIDYNVFYANCSIYSQEACSEYLLIDSVISNCDDKYNGTVTELTNKKLRIDYDAVKSVWYSPTNYGNYKGIILTRN